jgi:tyrosine-protein kinase Etk/Wzc
MNLPNPSAQLAQQTPAPMGEEEDSINLLDLLDVVLDQKNLIAAVVAAVLAIGGGYALMATPIYEANTLIQVEDSKGNPMGALMGEAGSLFDIKSPATAEIEILRSRLVVGQAVSNLQLDLVVTPKHVPVIGGWLARGKTEPSDPGFVGMKGYVTGNERIRIGTFDLPPSLEGERFSVVLADKGYELISPTGTSLGQGKLLAPLTFEYQGYKGSLVVGDTVGKPGAEFYVSKRSHLAVTERLQKDIKISEQGKQSGVLRTTLEGSRPEELKKILNEVGSLYVRQNTQRKSAEAEKSLAFLNTQLPQLKAQLEKSEASFNQFRTRQGTFDLNSEASTYLKQIVDLQVKLSELQAKRQELETRFTPKHPSIVGLDTTIRDVKAMQRDMEGKVKKMPAIEQDLLRLTRDVKVDSELYTNLLNSAQQLRLIKEGKVGNVRVIDEAVTPEKPIKPQRSMIVALSGVLGLLAGLGLAFLRNSLRPGIKNAEELEHRLGLNVFATVPLSAAQQQLDADTQAKKPGTHLLATLKPNEAAIESLRSLRTALQFAMLEAPNNIVLITGPTPNIGKSFTAANFAAVLSAAGQRVLLIDADMRKGHINQFFGLQRGMGLSELVSGTQTFDKVLHRNVAPGLDFITTGTMPPNPAELLMAPATQALLKTVSEQYDLVLIDSPPVLAVSDTAILAPQAGTIFMVVRADVSSLGEVQESVKRIAQSGESVKGIIFNGLDISKRRYGYGYGYGYGYKYKRYGYRYQSYNYGQDNKGK